MTTVLDWGAVPHASTINTRIRNRNISNFKFKCKIFYIVKGHLNVSAQTIEDCYDYYFKRMWNNNESYIHEEGFEDSYRVFMMGAK